MARAPVELSGRCPRRPTITVVESADRPLSADVSGPCSSSSIGLLSLGRFQRSVDFGDRWHARLVATLFDTVEGFRADAGSAGQLGLRKPQLAARAKNVAGLDDRQRLQGRIIAAGVRGRQLWLPDIR